tara:strand:+ start:1842 stop:2636 length:795 start_codon:yes stop_codon:yes gene_type:complete
MGFVKHRETIGKYIIAISVISLIFISGLLAGKMNTSITGNSVLNSVSNLQNENPRIITTKIIAIDENGKGVSANLFTEVRRGRGLVLVNINDVLADVNAQYSARIAKKAAEDFLERNLNDTDIVFNIITDATIVGGQSAGSAMAMNIVGLVLNEKLSNNVAITGSISENGTLVAAGEIYEKAKVAKVEGKDILLVPPGSSGNAVEYDKIRRCGKFDLSDLEGEHNKKSYCDTSFESRRINIGKDIGINVIEVEDVSEAAQYYFI